LQVIKFYHDPLYIVGFAWNSGSLAPTHGLEAGVNYLLLNNTVV